MKRNALKLCGIVLLCIMLTGCVAHGLLISNVHLVGAAIGPEGEVEVQTSLNSDAEKTPSIHLKEGGNKSPSVSISNLPDGTEELVVHLYGRHYSFFGGPYVKSYWLIYGLEKEDFPLPVGKGKGKKVPGIAGAKQGKNDFDTLGYTGPMSEREFGIDVLALSETTDLAPGKKVDAVLDHVNEYDLLLDKGNIEFQVTP